MSIKASVLAAALLVAACSPAGETSPGGADSMVGTYECLQPGASGPDIVVLGEDGSVSITHPDGVEESGVTWAFDGDTGTFSDPDGEVESFTIVGDGFDFEDGTTCTPAE